MEVNINKLKKRYGDKFSHTCANNRDLENERKVLEGEKNDWDEWLEMHEGSLGHW